MKKKLLCLGITVFVGAGLAWATPRPSNTQTFAGEISDSACGLHHTMGGGAKQCTLMCVQMGSKFVLADEANHKVYALSDQAKAKPFAGEKVEVTGTLKGSTIEVSSIKAAP
jgi:hypothetical protein